jgi:hypothetical protein
MSIFCAIDPREASVLTSIETRLDASRSKESERDEAKFAPHTAVEIRGCRETDGEGIVLIAWRRQE